MARTTLDIDGKLLKAVMEAIGAKTKKEAVETVLSEIVRKKNLELFRKELGKFNLDMTYEDLMRLRHEG